MGWIDRLKSPKIKGKEKTGFPEGLWTKCRNCSEVMFQEELEKNCMVCLKCGHHLKWTTRARIQTIADAHSFEELDTDLSPKDPLEFKDLKKYKDRIKALEKGGQEKEAFIYGRASVGKHPIILGSFVFEYMGGSMGSVVGEKIARAFELAVEEKKPCLLITTSGGARMQEGILSLMQMAKTSAAIAHMRRHGIPYLVLLADPTTGGVAASVAMLGDMLIAEPNALIGFAGPRVIEQTIKEKLPEGFQRSEYLLEHGILDRIVSRLELRSFFVQLFGLLSTPLERSGSHAKPEPTG